VRERQVETGRVWRDKAGRKNTKSRRNAGISDSVAPTSAAVDFTWPAPSVAPSIKAQPLQAAPWLAPNCAFALTKSAVTKIRLFEPAALGRSIACDRCKSVRRSHQIVIANHFFPTT
jgi:hypothetical protein